MTSKEERETMGCCGVDVATFGAPGSRWRWPAAATAGTGERPGDGPDTLPGCPMATMCGRMMKGRRFGLFVVVAGVALLTLGAAIALAPTVLTWLVAGALLCASGLILVTGSRTRRRDRRGA